MSGVASWNQRITHLRSALNGDTGLLMSTFRDAFDVAWEAFQEEHPVEMPYPGSDPHRAFVHAIQFYHPETVRRLIANYDPEQGEAALRSSVQKSIQSLAVIHRLFDFARTQREADALSAYRNTLERSLQTLLDAPSETLRQRQKLEQHFASIPSFPEDRRRAFLAERLQGLFSPHYHIYLTAKNRFFLKKLDDLAQNDEGTAWLLMRLGQLLGRPVKRWDSLLRKLDFRTVERLVKEGVLRLAQSDIDDTEEPPLEDLERPEPLSGNLEQAFREYCARNASPLKQVIRTLNPVDDCSAPHFQARIEDYVETALDGTRSLLGYQASFEAALLNVVQYWLSEADRQFRDSERWSAHPFERGGRLQREYSRMLGFRIPKLLRLDGETELPAGWMVACQLGVGAFDTDSDSLVEAPFIRFLIQGKTLSRKGPAIYIGRHLYYALEDEHLAALKQLFGWFLTSISLRFDLMLPPPLQRFILRSERR